MKYPDACVVVMSKAPVPGQVKTRLAPLLGRGGAARFYAELLDHTLDKVTRADLCRVELCCAPGPEHPAFDTYRDHPGIMLQGQQGDDIGERMYRAVERLLARFRRVVVIGADCPALSAGDIDRALGWLGSDADVVLGPAQDGGYYLLGMHADQPGLFVDVAWGGGSVLRQTLQNCTALALEVRLLETRMDLDTPVDLLDWRRTRMWSI